MWNMYSSYGFKISGSTATSSSSHITAVLQSNLHPCPHQSHQTKPIFCPEILIAPEFDKSNEYYLVVVQVCICVEVHGIWRGFTGRMRVLGGVSLSTVMFVVPVIMTDSD